jgi:GTP-binding protein Era
VEENTKTAFIAIVGRPNVGKSSLLNVLTGEKIAIVTNRPQTTRTRITGVLTEGGTQLVFTDTPGFHHPKTKLGVNMVKAVKESMDGTDACLFVTEPRIQPAPEELELLERISSVPGKKILAINKIDTVKDKSSLASVIAAWNEKCSFDATVPVSALKGTGTDELRSELFAAAVPSAWYFPEDTLTDQPERVLCAEMVREKMLMLISDEIPHGTAVITESMKMREDKPDLMDVSMVIYCEKESHKAIIIGKNGSMIKRISTLARHDMEEFFGCRVNLRCFVKVKEAWRNKESLINNFGLECK